MKNKKKIFYSTGAVAIVVIAFFLGGILGKQDKSKDIVILYTNDVHCGIV